MFEIADALDVESVVGEQPLPVVVPAGGIASGDRVAAQLQIPDVGPGRFGMVVKRVFDLIIASVLLVLALPVGVVIALAIRSGSPGPVFFWQTRVGLRGRHFRVLKFRTMVHDAEARKSEIRHLNEADGLFKIRADPRTTGIGRFLRRTYLDELPQLVNVVRGEMSLVGPRPLVPDEDRVIKGSGRQRLQVPPGMTGEWQLLHGGGASMDEMMAMDYRYVAGWSLWRDLRCLGKTAMYMCARKGW
jgi:lipopolysaccharide/colanic/teichoic acid biosynthesis glycosyltransferase